MAECIIARGGGRSDGGFSGPPIIADKHTILVTVTDSNNQVINDLSVHCKDGDNWYNYHTNDKGQVLFVTNSGAANITAWNFSINGNYKYIDQAYVSKNIDAPVGLSTTLNLALGFQANEVSFNSMTSNIFVDKCYSGNYKVRVANHVNVFVGGAGGGGGGSYETTNTSDEDSVWGGCGGGGGGISIGNSIALTHDSFYLFYTGSKGIGGKGYREGSTGGTSSAFGISATGGEGGNCGGFSSGSGQGTGNYNGGNGSNNYSRNGGNSRYSNWGGGGGMGEEDSDNRNFNDYTRGGNPYGANGASSHGSNGPSATNGGGGGGASGRVVSHPSGTYKGGDGGPGKISFTFY